MVIKAELNTLAIWFLAALLILSSSSIILYIYPSFPIVILISINIEIIIFANIIVYIRKIRKALTIRRDKFINLKQMETET